MIKLSPSSINLFMEEPALWIIKHFHKVKSGPNKYSARGRIIEAYLDGYLQGLPVGVTLHNFRETYYHETFDVETRQEVDHFEETLNYARKVKEVFMEAIEDSPVEYQPKISADSGKMFGVEGAEIMGYIDYMYDDYCIDLKTTKSIPHILTRGPRAGQLPAGKAANVRQQVIYQLATDKVQKLFYIGENGDNLLYEVSDKDHNDHFTNLQLAVGAMINIDKEGEDYAIRNYYPKNTKSFYWDEDLRELANKLWSK